MADAGTVVINLDANSVKLLRELQKADRSTKNAARRMRQNMVREFQAIGRQAALMTTAVAGAMAAATKASVDLADNIAKTADRIGISTDSLQELRFAAAQTGVDLNQFEQAMTALVRRQGEAVAGNKEFGKGFERLGISVQELQGMHIDELMNRVADGLQRLPDQASRIATLDRVMSEAGRRIINVFGDGAASLQAFRDQARELGIVIDERLLRSAEEVADKMNILNTVVRTQVASALLKLAPAIIAVSENFTEMATEAGKVDGEAWAGAEGAVNAVAFIMDSVDGARRSFMVFGRSIAVFFAHVQLMLLNLANTIVNGPGAAMDWVIRKADQIPGIDIDFQFGAPMPVIQATMDEVEAIIREGVADINEILMEPMAGDALLARFEEVKARMAQAAPATGASTGGGVTPPVAPPGTIGSDDGVDDAFLEMQRRAAEIVAQTRTDFEQYVEKLNEAYQLWNTFDDQGNRLLDTESYWRYVDELESGLVQIEERADETTSKMSVFAEQAARNMQDQFADFLFDPFDDGLKGMLKGFIDTMRRMVAEAASAAIFDKLGGIGGIGSFISGIFGGPRAMGGPVAGGSAYLVGERGPELFVPGSSGNIIPNHAMGGDIVFNIDARGADAQLTRALPAILEAHGQRIKGDIAEGFARRRGIR